MATTNIQETGLESSIYFIEADISEENIKMYRDDETFKDYTDEDIKEVIYNDFNEDLWEYYPELLSNTESVKVYDKYNKTWETLHFTIKIASCYYNWVNLIIVSDYDFSEMELSTTSKKRIERVIKKLEKVCKQIAGTELKCVWVASNWEGFYEKI